MNLATIIALYAVLLSTSTEKEHRLRLEFDDLSAQSSALVETVDRMEAVLQKRGEILHPEITSARNHLLAAIASAADALQEQNWRLLEKRLNRARGWLEKLERRL